LPAEAFASIPAYCHVSFEYFPFSGSHPEKRPSATSAST
jgi:hypothetical protein